jgi:hypothetical protein
MERKGYCFKIKHLEIAKGKNPSPLFLACPVFYHEVIEGIKG